MPRGACRIALSHCSPDERPTAIDTSRGVLRVGDAVFVVSLQRGRAEASKG